MAKGDYDVPTELGRHNMSPEREFLVHVRNMRYWQKRYFLYSRTSDLEVAKRYERLVDAYIAKIYEPELNLFK